MCAYSENNTIQKCDHYKGIIKKVKTINAVVGTLSLKPVTTKYHKVKISVGAEPLLWQKHYFQNRDGV